MSAHTYTNRNWPYYRIEHVESRGNCGAQSGQQIRTDRFGSDNCKSSRCSPIRALWRLIMRDQNQNLGSNVSWSDTACCCEKCCFPSSRFEPCALPLMQSVTVRSPNWLEARRQKRPKGACAAEASPLCHDFIMTLWISWFEMHVVYSFKNLKYTAVRTWCTYMMTYDDI